MSAFDELAAADVDLLATARAATPEAGELVPRRILAEAVTIAEDALSQAKYLRGEHPGEEWWEPWCEDHPGDHPGDPNCRSCLGASHDAWMHRAKAAEYHLARVVETWEDRAEPRLVHSDMDLAVAAAAREVLDPTMMDCETPGCEFEAGHEEKHPCAKVGMRTIRDRVLGAMRSGEWLRTQWIVRVVYRLGSTPIKDVPAWTQKVMTTRRHLDDLVDEGRIEHREAFEEKPYGPIPRDEWRKL